MHKSKHITVTVPLDLYRQTRKLAAEYDTTVTALVAYLLERMPIHLKNAGFRAREAKNGPIRGPKELAKVKRFTLPSWYPPSPLIESAKSAKARTSSSSTPADSAISDIPFEAITAAVCNYESASHTFIAA